ADLKGISSRSGGRHRLRDPRAAGNASPPSTERPRWVSIRWITAGSSIVARTVIRPPQLSLPLDGGQDDGWGPRHRVPRLRGRSGRAKGTGAVAVTSAARPRDSEPRP